VDIGSYSNGNRGETKNLDMQKFPQYDIDLFIEEACKMPYVDLISFCQQKYGILSNRKISKKPGSVSVWIYLFGC
jgi:hypothetical protein